MKISAATAVVALLLAFPGSVFGLGTETFGNAPVVKQPDWAAGVVNVANLPSRVYSRWINGNENFFYRGSARALNEALRKYAAVADDVHQLVLLPGPGKTQTFDGRTVQFDWQFHVPSGIYKAVSKQTHAVLTVYVKGTKPRAPRDRKQVEQWLAELNSDQFQTREHASRELQKLGNDAKPFLREALQARPAPEARRSIERLLDRLQDIDVTDLEIPRGLTVVGVDDLVAVDLKRLKATDQNVRGMAAYDLSRLAPYNDRVVPVLTALLKKGENEYVRRVAAGGLANIGVEARSALPALKAGLGDPDANIRHAFQAAIDHLEKAKTPPGHAAEVKQQQSILKEIQELKRHPSVRRGGRD